MTNLFKKFGIFYVFTIYYLLFTIFIGHSFPINSSGWIPQYELPSIIVLPPCIPPFSVYTTFLIKRFGHLPLMFCFFPPANSHFIVKPFKIECFHQSWPVGSIDRDIKIHPLCETVLPGKSEKITVSVTPHTPITICKLHCMCELPTLKVSI